MLSFLGLRSGGKRVARSSNTAPTRRQNGSFIGGPGGLYLEEAGLRRGDEIVVEALDDGEVLVLQVAPRFETAFGALTGVYPSGCLARLDAEDAER